MINTVRIVKGKRSQTEIVGLVIVMVLVVMGILFTMTFLFVKEDKSMAVEFGEADLPQSMVDAFLKMSSFSCTDRTVDQVLRDCVTSSGSTCAGKTMCEVVKSDAVTLFKDTLDAWGNVYILSFTGVSITKLESVGADSLPNTGICSFGESRLGSQVRNFGGIPVEITLRICG